MWPLAQIGPLMGRLWAAGHLHWAAWIFGLAFVIRIAWLFFVNPDPFDGDYHERGFYDAVFYYVSAQGIAGGEGYRDPDFLRATAAFPPGYPLMLAGLFVVFGSNLVVAKLFNVFLGGVLAVLVYALASRIGGQRVGVAAGILIAFFPSQIFISTLVMTETLFSLLSMVLVMLLIAWVSPARGLRGWQVLVVGLLLGYMTLVRAETVLLIPMVPIVWVLAGVPWRRSAVYVPVLLVGIAVVITPWSVRNYVVFDEVIVLRHEDSESFRTVRVGLSPDYDDAEKYQFFQQDPPTFGELISHYARQPWDIAAVGGRKVFDLYHSDAPLHWIQGEHDPPPLSPDEVTRWTFVANWYYYVVGIGALIGAHFWLGRRNRALLVLLWFVAAWSVMHLMFRPAIRYHYPINPITCILAALVLVGVWDSISKRKWPFARAEP